MPCVRARVYLGALGCVYSFRAMRQHTTPEEITFVWSLFEVLFCAHVWCARTFTRARTCMEHCLVMWFLLVGCYLAYVIQKQELQMQPAQ